MATGASVGRALSAVTAGKLTPRAIRSQRAFTLFVMATGILSLHLFRLAQLQLVQGQYNHALAENNRIRRLPMVADRGNILDRHGKILVANKLTRAIYLYPREQTRDQWQATAQQLGGILNITPQQIVQKLEKAGYRSTTPVRIMRNIKADVFTALAESGYIPGVEVQPESNRVYPHKKLGSHILGYIGEASEAQLRKNSDWPMGMLVGQMGLERLADDRLRGQWGNRLFEVDAAGKELRMLGIQRPTSGETLKSTLDLQIQKAAETGLANRRGAVVVIDVETGGIMAMASGPTFDPNMFTRRITQKEVDEVFNNPHKPFLNRALQGYPPASTFKIVSSVAGLQSGKYNPNSKIMTAAALNIGGTVFHEHGSGYGAIGFKTALEVSSNTFFYQLGRKVGSYEIHKWAHKLGIGETKTFLDGESQGLIPTPEIKKTISNEPWYTGDEVTMAIGQGMVTVTPMELAVVVAAIGNGGHRVKPHFLLDQASDPQFKPENIGLKPSTISTVRAGLELVVKSGTATSLNDGSIPLTAGKTGTAEVPGGADNAVYVGYGPAKNPKIAVAVIVERGGFGSTSAVPIAHQVYKAYFSQGKQKSQPKGIQAQKTNGGNVAQR
ncbi:penicillin-binding protein 2 [filamentous cyanobacterium LEGE 11480]|uniref:Penicillin-binding protein 2 n=1 Tax=Romeriopsis navalis LEGE 11480 TaxID=2777977 RepID=A0A928VRJ3_9CYAN|nr:penicillin-binding protein 2 [Romeriopsis navalis]MBE9033195.1 penicillin-binding protein 2 [Romeriopsis navalis LEGE 11480]